MNHPLRTLLRELFVDPVLRMLRIGRRERKEALTKRSLQWRATEIPTVSTKSP